MYKKLTQLHKSCIYVDILAYFLQNGYNISILHPYICIYSWLTGECHRNWQCIIIKQHFHRLVHTHQSRLYARGLQTPPIILEHKVLQISCPTICWNTKTNSSSLFCSPQPQGGVTGALSTIADRWNHPRCPPRGK